MSTFEGPMMSIKTVNALSHYTDWTIGHVHSGALGWVGFVSIGAMYCLVPWLWAARAVQLQADQLALLDRDHRHRALHHAMWVAGVMQGLMWRAINDDGTLTYTFVESVKATYPFYVVRLAGGLLFLIGMLIMAYNVAKTIGAGRAVDDPIPLARPTPEQGAFKLS
jgi:cytochrome c oxidase cbb3-type subunit I